MQSRRVALAFESATRTAIDVIPAASAISSELCLLEYRRHKRSRAFGASFPRHFSRASSLSVSESAAGASAAKALMAASLSRLDRFLTEVFKHFQRAILQAHATKFVPSSKVEAFRETVRKVSCSTSSASANEGCKALTNARIEFSCRTNNNCTSSVALGEPRWSSEVFITSNVRGDAIVSEKQENSLFCGRTTLGKMASVHYLTCLYGSRIGNAIIGSFAFVA